MGSTRIIELAKIRARNNRRLLLVLLNLLAVAMGGLSFLIVQNRSLKFTPYFFTRQITAIERVSGHLYTAPRDRPKGLSLTEMTTVQVLEDEKVMDVSGSLREEVQIVGKGRYYLSDAGVFFSSTDNSDPRTNGRRYSYRYALIVPGEVAVTLYVFSLLVILMATVNVFSWLRLGRQMRARMRTLLPVLSVNLFLISITLIIGEMVFNRLYPNLQFRKTWPLRFVPEVGFTFEPGSMVRHTNYLDFGTEGQANSLGFLDTEPAAASEDCCRVVFIGDSFVEAAQVRISEKVQRLLENKVRDKFPEWDLRTAAFGFSGTGQINQLPFYDRFARNYRPRLVVLVFVTNDFSNNSLILESLRIGTHPDFPLWTYAKRVNNQFKLINNDITWRNHLIEVSGQYDQNTWWIHSFLKDKSSIYKWLWLRLSLKYDFVNAFEPQVKEIIRVRARILMADSHTRPLLAGWDDKYALNMEGDFSGVVLDPLYQEAYELTRFGLEEFRRRTERDGSKLVILAASQMRSINPAIYGKLSSLAGELNIPLIDQYDYIVRSGGDPRKAMFSFDMHWTPEGHRWAAEAVLEYLRREGICRYRAEKGHAATEIRKSHLAGS